MIIVSTILGGPLRSKRPEREYNHQYWLNNRDRLLKSRAMKASGRDYEKELSDLNRRQYELEQDRKHDEWNANQRIADANKKADEYNDYYNEAVDRLETDGYLQRMPNGKNLLSYPIENTVVPEYYDSATRARSAANDQNQLARQERINSAIASNRSIQQQNALRTEINRTQREFNAAIEAASGTPISRIEEAAHNASRAIASALDKISDVTVSTLSRLRR